MAKDNPDIFGVFTQLIEKFEKEENYEEALNFVRQAKTQFPGQAKNLLEKEVELLLDSRQIFRSRSSLSKSLSIRFGLKRKSKIFTIF